MYKSLIKIIVFNLVIGLFMTSCATIDTNIEQSFFNRKLNSINLIKQPDGNTCGAACIKMVENYYFDNSNSFNNIWQEISDISSKGRISGKTYKIGKYLENRDLYTSIIRFSDLKKILSYCETNQIPAIMNVHSFENASFGHFVVFTQYLANEKLVGIRDPENNKRELVNFNVLRKNFKKTSSKDEIGGNIIILASEKLNNRKEYICKNCNKINIVDAQILDAISGLICTNCDNFISVRSNK